MDKAIAHLSANDIVLAKLIKSVGRRPTIVAHTNYYSALVSSIISQQLSVKAADKIEERFMSLFGSVKDFPTADKILTKSFDELRSVGLSRPKVAYIRDLAEKVVAREVVFDHFPRLSNEQIIAELTTIKGIGEWTSHMFLMFCMGRLNVLASGDLGVKNGIKQLYNLKSLPSSQKIEQIARKNKWEPYQTVACWYIWQSLENMPVI